MYPPEKYPLFRSLDDGRFNILDVARLAMALEFALKLLHVLTHCTTVSLVVGGRSATMQVLKGVKSAQKSSVASFEPDHPNPKLYF